MKRGIVAAMGVLAIASVLMAVVPAGARSVQPSIQPIPCRPEVKPDIWVMDGSYSPIHQTGLTPGSSQEWYWQTSGALESVTSTHLPLFHSALKSGGIYSFEFFASGTYPYHSTNDSTQKGTVAIGLCDVRSTAAVGSTVWVQYASQHHSGWQSDIEVKRPGTSSWSWLAYGLTGTLTSFKPTRTGTYSLRARLRHTTDNKSSGFSPIKTVKVN